MELARFIADSMPLGNPVRPCMRWWLLYQMEARRIELLPAECQSAILPLDDASSFRTLHSNVINLWQYSARYKGLTHRLITSPSFATFAPGKISCASFSIGFASL